MGNMENNLKWKLNRLYKVTSFNLSLSLSSKIVFHPLPQKSKIIFTVNKQVFFIFITDTKKKKSRHKKFPQFQELTLKISALKIEHSKPHKA